MAGRPPSSPVGAANTSVRKARISMGMGPEEGPSGGPGSRQSSNNARTGHCDNCFDQRVLTYSVQDSAGRCSSSLRRSSWPRWLHRGPVRVLADQPATSRASSSRPISSPRMPRLACEAFSDQFPREYRCSAVRRYTCPPTRAGVAKMRSPKSVRCTISGASPPALITVSLPSSEAK